MATECLQNDQGIPQENKRDTWTGQCRNVSWSYKMWGFELQSFILRQVSVTRLCHCGDEHSATVESAFWEPWVLATWNVARNILLFKYVLYYDYISLLTIIKYICTISSLRLLSSDRCRISFSCVNLTDLQGILTVVCCNKLESLLRYFPTSWADYTTIRKFGLGKNISSF